MIFLFVFLDVVLCGSYFAITRFNLSRSSSFMSMLTDCAVSRSKFDVVCLDRSESIPSPIFEASSATAFAITRVSFPLPVIITSSRIILGLTSTLVSLRSATTSTIRNVSCKHIDIIYTIIYIVYI